VATKPAIVPPAKWKWFGTHGHLCVGRWCRFHMATQIGKFLISTVGEYWPDRPSREIHAQCHDAAWFSENRHLTVDAFDAAYFKRFGYKTIGCDRTYETMVFRAGKPCAEADCGCGLPEIDGSELDVSGYNSRGDATRGHLKMCKKWAARSAARREGADRADH